MIGFVQWLALRHEVKRAGWWILASGAGFGWAVLIQQMGDFYYDGVPITIVIDSSLHLWHNPPYRSAYYKFAQLKVHSICQKEN